ncbi:MAG: HD domain-containing protein [Candidatus Magasanikbacteria bacterium]|nr:HD domain-containing protein [Candidatus Magasanikbacteria bacterium]
MVKPARILGLNHELCSASAIGHDIGHTPFGHAGESFLAEVTGKKFRHNIFSVVIAQFIERTGSGLGLTHQTLSGMKNHSRGGGDVVSDLKASLEDNLLMLGDKIAYTWSDINDIFFRLKLLDIADFPELQILMNWFGNNQRERMKTCIIGLCNESVEKNTISFIDSDAGAKFNRIKKLCMKKIW